MLNASLISKKSRALAWLIRNTCALYRKTRRNRRADMCFGGKKARKALQALKNHENNRMIFIKNSRFFFELELMNHHRFTK
jgi:hypothetical protein